MADEKRDPFQVEVLALLCDNKAKLQNMETKFNTKLANMEVSVERVSGIKRWRFPTN